MGGQESSSLFCAATSPFRISNDSRSSIVAKFRAGFISHNGLKIEREISHTFEIRNFPQRNIPVAKFPPPLYSIFQPRNRVGLFSGLKTSMDPFLHQNIWHVFSGHKTVLVCFLKNRVALFFGAENRVDLQAILGSKTTLQSHFYTNNQCLH